MANPAWETILVEALGAFELGKLTFTIDNVTVSIAGAPGAPVHSRLPQRSSPPRTSSWARPASFRSGNVLVTIGSTPTTASNATPAAAAIASAIAASVTPSGPAVLTPAAAASTSSAEPAAEATASAQPSPGYPVHAIAH